MPQPDIRQGHSVKGIVFAGCIYGHIAKHEKLSVFQWLLEAVISYNIPGEAWALNAGFFLTTVLDVLQNYVSRRDKIVASAVELIGDLGLNALTTKNLARKENISETLIYKYFGGIDEVLTEVVLQYTF